MTSKKSSSTFTEHSKPLKGFKPITSLRVARKLTSDFHQQQQQQNTSDNNKRQRITTTNNNVSRTNYQLASVLLTNTHKSTSHFVFKTLTQLNLRPKRTDEKKKLRVLEIGAVNLQLISCPFLDVTAIDMKSRHPQLIQEIDFFDFIDAQRYDGIVIAMVLNCIPTAKKRGEMLQKCIQQHLHQNGWIVCILPVRCLGVTTNLFVEFLSQVNLECTYQESTDKIHRLFLQLKMKPEPTISSSSSSITTKPPIQFKYHDFEIVLL
jgi:25S rRNA (adenine2142-N1)-methyltransferase